MFTSAEGLGLVMAVLDGHHDASDPTDPVGSALGKLLRALPESVTAQAEAVRRATAPAPDRGAARPDPGTTAALVQASTDHCAVRLGYRSEAGSEWEAEVDPWAVVVRHGRWYLLCRSHRSGEVRAYRVDRVRSVERAEATFEPPAGLDPVALLESHLALGWEYQVEVVVAAPPEDARRQLPSSLGRVEPVGDGRSRLVATTSNPWWYAERLAALTVPFEVVGGAELRHTVRRVGERMVAAVPDEDVLPGP